MIYYCILFIIICIFSIFPHRRRLPGVSRRPYRLRDEATCARALKMNPPTLNGLAAKVGLAVDGKVPGVDDPDAFSSGGYHGWIVLPFHMGANSKVMGFY